MSGVGEPICPNTTQGVVRVITSLNIPGKHVSPFLRVPIAGVKLTLFGFPPPALIVLKTRTICSTDPSPVADPSSRLLMIGGKVVRTLFEQEVSQSLKSGEPLDVVWVNEDNDLSPSSE